MSEKQHLGGFELRSNIVLTGSLWLKGTGMEPGRWRRPGPDQGSGGDGVLAVQEVRRARIWIPGRPLYPAGYL